MTRPAGIGFPGDELLLGILLTTGGIVFGGAFGRLLALLGLLLGVGAYLVATGLVTGGGTGSTTGDAEESG